MDNNGALIAAAANGGKNAQNPQQPIPPHTHPHPRGKTLPNGPTNPGVKKGVVPPAESEFDEDDQDEAEYEEDDYDEEEDEEEDEDDEDVDPEDDVEMRARNARRGTAVARDRRGMPNGTKPNAKDDLFNFGSNWTVAGALRS